MQDSKDKNWFKKGNNTETKKDRPICLLSLILEKSIHNQMHNYVYRNQSCTFTNQTLEQIVLPDTCLFQSNGEF